MFGFLLRRLAGIDPAIIFFASLGLATPCLIEDGFTSMPFGWALVASAMFGPLLLWMLLRAWIELVDALGRHARRGR